MIELNSLFRAELYLMAACLLLCEWSIKRLFALIAFAKESLESVVSDCVFLIQHRQVASYSTQPLGSSYEPNIPGIGS